MSQRRCGWRPEDPLERAASIVVAVGRFAAVLPGYQDDVNQFVTDGSSTLESSAVMASWDAPQRAEHGAFREPCKRRRRCLTQG